MRLTIWCLGLVLVAGCSGAAPRPEAAAVSGREKVLDVNWPYLAACRAVLDEMRQQFGDSIVMHEIWPDIQQAKVHVATAGRGGLLVLVTITATEQNRCSVHVFCSNNYWRERTWPRIERALLAAPEASKR